MYKSNSKFGGSKITDQVCDLIDWAYIGAIITMVRGGVVYVKATLLKPNEVHGFKKLDGMVLNGMPIKTMNF